MFANRKVAFSFGYLLTNLTNTSFQGGNTKSSSNIASKPGPVVVPIDGQAAQFSPALIIQNGQTMTAYVNPTASVNGSPVIFAPQVMTIAGQVTTVFQGIIPSQAIMTSQGETTVIESQRTVIVDALGSTMSDMTRELSRFRSMTVC